MQRKASIFKIVLIHLLHLVFFYLVIKCQHINKLIISSLSEITRENFIVQLLLHMTAMLIFPITVIAGSKLKSTDLGITSKNILLCGILFALYIVFFFLHNDFSYGGIYRAVYLLFSIAIGEELFFHGWSYKKLRQIIMPANG